MSRANLVRIMRIVGIVFAVIFLFSGVRIIQPGEVGVLLRLGKLPFGPSAVYQPGLMIAFPYPIDEVIRVPVQQNKEMVIDGFWQPEGADDNATSFHPFKQAYTLSADYNVVLPENIRKIQHRRSGSLGHQ